MVLKIKCGLDYHDQSDGSVFLISNTGKEASSVQYMDETTLNRKMEKTATDTTQLKGAMCGIHLGQCWYTCVRFYLAVAKGALST